MRAIQSNSKPESFFHDCVRHLHLSCIDVEAVKNAPTILSACTGLQTLRLVLDTNQIQPHLLLPALTALKLRQLSAYLQLIFASPMLNPMLASLTHLDVFDSIPPNSDDAQIPRWLIQFPVLTHVTMRAGSVRLARNILTAYKNLRVLIFLHLRWNKYPKAEDFPSTEDDRLLYMLSEDAWNEEHWVTGSNRGVDFWVSAEVFIAKKRRGEIVPNTRCWIEKEDGIGCEYFADSSLKGDSTARNPTLGNGGGGP
ncbi:hypothetical protein MSAN_02467900 [Mycena sanguinolenta]|uniref:Uncharacterized protein n=1 Tax=Mycena sanguinolenta TaxID=230812 RepID=A0A8H6U029_9AGAR|nr:hypothetical protein MSAN_02467900 [Mycena sanguinolenta]